MVATGLESFLPQDRRAALAGGRPLPDRAAGSALFADIAGFTPLAEALARELGPRRGAEELTQRINEVYDALIGVVEGHGGSVIGFSGDAITCWFGAGDGGPGAAALRAAACALALQGALRPLAEVATPGGERFALALSVGAVSGAVRRFLVGDPDEQVLDALAGRLLDRLFAAEALAMAGEVLADEATARLLGAAASFGERRAGGSGEDFVVLESVLAGDAPPGPAGAGAPSPRLAESQLRPWVPRHVYERVASGARLLAELRPAVALMLRFSGIDYDEDEGAGATLDGYMRWVQGVVASRGGYLVDLTMGHANSYLYIAFGAPTAHGDDAARAVGAALALAAPPPAHGAVSATRIGVALGQVRAGLIGGAGRRAFGVLGDPANLAFRLMQRAPAGEVWCDEASYRAARGAWAFEELPPVQVKGKAAARRVFRPTGAPAPAEAAAPALVGRAAELARLAAAADEVAAGACRVLLVSGEAGIGKSRLAREAAALARGRGLAVLPGAGQSIEQQTPYRAWRPILEARFGLAGARGPAGRRSAVEALAPPELAERLALLDDILDLGLPQTALVQGLDVRLRSESLGELVIALLRAGDAPPALIVEDAHWLDSRSLELLARVGRAFAAARLPLLLVLTTRPLDPDDPRHAQLAALLTLPGAAQVGLGQLGDDDVVALAAARLGVAAASLPPAAAGLLRRRAGGNPLFAEELAEALRDRGLLDGDEQARTAGDPDEADDLLPGTLQGLLLARVDRLPPPARQVLKVAAVVGPTFAYGPLEHACARHAAPERPELKNRLRHLAAGGLTWLEAPEPELAYRFRHVLLQEAVYETLLFAQRRELHRAVAEWYEGAGAAHDGAPPYPLLAHHYRHAEDAGRERHYARLAGVGAADRYANAEAVAFFSRALELTPPEDEAGRRELLLAREQIYDRLGEREAQLADLEALARLSQGAADPGRAAEAALRLANYHVVTGDYPAAIAAAQGVLAALPDGDDPRRRAEAHLHWGRALRFLAAYADAAARLEVALAEALILGDARLEGEALRQLGAVAFFQDDYAGARAYDEAALATARVLGDRAGEAHALDALGSDASELGDYAAAVGYYEQARALFEAVGDQWGLCANLGNLAQLYREQGDYDAAAGANRAGLRLARVISDRRTEGVFLAGLGWAALDLGAYEEAERAFGQALAIGDGGEGDAWWARSGLALLSSVRGDHGRAIALSAEVRAWASASGARAREGDAWLCAGRSLAAEGRLEAALDAYSQALGIWDELRRASRAVEARAGLIEVALASDERAAALAEAETILAALAGGPPVGADEPLRVYLLCYRALLAAGDPRAGAVLAEGAALLRRRAATIGDDTARRAYLGRVTAHRELLAAEGEGRRP